MRTVLTSGDARSAERAAVEAGRGTFALMEAAGVAAARAIRAFTGPAATLVMCGPGNNGGDGYVVAAALARAGWPVRVAALAPAAADPARTAAAHWTGPVEPLADATSAPLLVDALFGIGAVRPLAADTAAAVARLSSAARLCVALDLPSGVDADSGAAAQWSVPAVLTVAFGSLKPAHLLHPAAALCGRIVIADLGLDPGSARLWMNAPPRPRALEPATHKYARGHVLVLGGGPGAGGAARLAARAALRTGAGLVTLAVPAAALAENAARLDAVMLRALGDAQALAKLATERRATALVLGPGLGVDAPARLLADAAIALELSLVLDADVFTLFAGRPEALRRAAPTVLTPHEGEFIRLMGEVAGSKVERARAAAARTGAVVLLKGPDTVIAAPDGRAVVNAAAAPWLATAGSGDVLAGAIAGRLAAGDAPFEAACAAAWWHARAGERAGPGLIADDLPELLAAVMRNGA